MRDIKANSSGWIHKTFPTLRAFAWQEGYGAFTVSSSQPAKLERYIANQEAHHRKQLLFDTLVSGLLFNSIVANRRADV